MAYDIALYWGSNHIISSLALSISGFHFCWVDPFSDGFSDYVVKVAIALQPDVLKISSLVECLSSGSSCTSP